jgi:membrane fusion protein, copper/silver efflux system
MGDGELPMPEGAEPPPRGTKVMGVVRWLMLAASVALAGFTWLSFAREQLKSSGIGATQAQPKYRCPMHPQIVSSEPGECPICHMQLEPIASEDSTPAGKDTGASSPAAASSSAVLPGSTPPGTAPLKLTLDRIQAIGVRTSLATEKDTQPTLRVTATIAAPEQGVAEVHVRSAGFVEQMGAAQTGTPVREGQMLVAIYSPELYQAETELLTARRWSTDADRQSRDAARLKLRLLGMAERDIDHVVEKGEPTRAVRVLAPQGGVVIKKNVAFGSYVTPEMVLFEIQDLSHVQVIADVFEKDVSTLTLGMEGRFRSSRAPAASVTAKIDLIYPTLNVEAHTTRVRMRVPNKDHLFAPGEYGTVELALPKRKVLVVPRDAVVDTGMAAYVFVVESEGRFSPRVVTIAASDGDDTAISEGLSPGDRVVSSATFLIDSESRLQAAAQAAAVVTP